MPHLVVAVDMAPFLLAALTLAVVLLWIFACHHPIGIGLLLASQVWTVTAHGRVPALDLGVHAYPADILATCACLVAFSRLLRHRLPTRAGVLLMLGMCVLTAWSMARGIGGGGLQAAANDSRVYFFQVFAFTLYVATAPPNAAVDRVIRRAWLAAAAAYVLLSLAGWAGTGLLSVGASVTAGGVTTDPRPVPANAALMLAQGAVLLLCPPASDPAAPGAAGGDRPGPGLHRVVRLMLALLLVVCVILLQHRTVWAATAAVAVMYWVLPSSRAGRRIVVAVVGTLVGCLTVVCFGLGTFGSVGSKLAVSFAETQEAHSTFTWRVLGWQKLLSAPRSWAEWLFGAPFGAGYARVVEGGLTTVSPHNYYVHVALRLGLVGLALLLALYAQVWRRLARNGSDGLWLRLLIVSQLMFCATYSVFPEQGLVLGLCLWRIRVGAADRGALRPSAGVPRPADGREVYPASPYVATGRARGTTP
jgi:hypothetical protein